MNTGRTRSHRTPAIVALACAGSLWGTSFIFGKVALRELDPEHMLIYRFLFASLALAPLLFSARYRIAKRDLWLFMVTGFLYVPASFIVQFEGLQRTTASRAALIVGAMPLAIALLSVLFDHERLGWKRWGALVISTAGVALIIGNPGKEGSVAGDLLVLASLLGSVGWILPARNLTRRYSAITATIWIILCGTVLLIPIALVWRGVPPIHLSAETWFAVAAQGLLCTVATTVLWNWGVSRVETSTAGIFVNLEPLVGVFLGIMLLHESVGKVTLAGGGLIVVSALYLSFHPVPEHRT